MDRSSDIREATPSPAARSRRRFLKRAALAACAATILHPATIAGPSADRGGFQGQLCFFSKHLAAQDWRQLSESVKRLGFDGLDLTVRQGGHVAPERAAADLPRAVSIIRERGLAVPMITTALTSAADPTAHPIFSSAAKLGIPYLKPGYYKYRFVDVERELEEAGREFRGLAELGRQHRVQIGFHNHAGYIGAPVWDIARIIGGLDPRWVGYYFDVRHAVVEGGEAGWRIAANFAAKRLKMIAVKDFYWDKTAAGGWRVRDCPLGQGMVDWKRYARLLAEANFHGPVSLHIEYEITGPTPAAREENMLVAARRDLEFLKDCLAEAYAGGAK